MSNIVVQPLVIELPYLPAVAWMREILRHDVVLLDKHEHYEKGSYRNRCHLLGPNGIQRLSIPLVHGKHQHKKMSDVEISYDQEWQKIHWMTLCSCYRRSAFFEYYEDQLAPFYEKKYKFLFDFNFELLQFVLDALGVKKEFHFTGEYLKPSENIRDKRSAVMPGVTPELSNQNEPYTQVFSDRFPFYADLSIIDHIFNNGNKFII